MSHYIQTHLRGVFGYDDSRLGSSNWQNGGLQNRMLGVRIPPESPLFTGKWL